MLLINSQARSKFQLEVKNRFRALQPSENDDPESSYKNFVKVMDEATASSVPRKKRTESEQWVSNQSMQLAEERKIARKTYNNHRNEENYNKWRLLATQTEESMKSDKSNYIKQYVKRQKTHTQK